MAAKIFFDLFIYTLILLSCTTLLTGNVNLISKYPISLIITWLSVIIGSLLTDQYSYNNYKKLLDYIKQIFTALVISFLFLLLYFLFEKELQPYLNIILIVTLCSGFIIKFFLYILNNVIIFKKEDLSKINFSIGSFNIEFLIVSAIICYAYFIKYDIKYFEKDFIAIITFIIIWFLIGLCVHQFNPVTKYNFWKFIWLRLKSYLYFLIIFNIILYILSSSINGINIIRNLSFLFGFIAIPANSFFYLIRKKPSDDVVKYKFIRASEVFDEPLLKYLEVKKEKYYVEENESSKDLFELLSEVYLKRFPEVFNFINDTLNLALFNFRKCIMHRSSDMYNVEVLPENALEMYVNLHEINDMRRINKYFIQVNSKLKDGGVFIGNVEPNNLRRKRFLFNYPYYLAVIFYFIDFIWHRVFPKLPAFKHFYFAITKGKHRAISLSETLGRLYYCGFEVIAIKEINNLIYFIAKKIKEPLSDDSPSYGPLIKLKRVGKDGNIIKVYKFRTMYPYSEYLQRFIFEKANLQEGGKFKDDFRITSWGKVLRKLWLDELPMFINYFKGELKIVGVRPLSLQYFYLYDEELRNRRIKYKPGLVPPFYYDLPKTLDEIMASERKYLDSYDKHPIITDIRYFIVSAYNILIRKARSN
ncbi:sugar transferase [Rosettibacter firmus]|uniref:sugar transferase n=1 Tax=Rosettibacter firmus TaxID=3111522 RepID=UPI00336BF40C